MLQNKLDFKNIFFNEESFDFLSLILESFDEHTLLNTKLSPTSRRKISNTVYNLPIIIMNDEFKLNEEYEEDELKQSLLDKFYNMYCNTANANCRLNEKSTTATNTLSSCNGSSSGDSGPCLKPTVDTTSEYSSTSSSPLSSLLLVRRKQNLDEICVRKPDAQLKLDERLENESTFKKENRKVDLSSI